MNRTLNNSYWWLCLPCKDTRNADLAIVKRTIRGGVKVVAVATWLGHRIGDWERTERAHTLSGLYQFLPWLSNVKNQVRTWTALAGRQSQAAFHSILCKTHADHHNKCNVHGFHWSPSLESLLGANFEHIRHTDGSKQCHCEQMLIFGWAPHLINMRFQSFSDFVWVNGTCRHYFLYYNRQIHKQTITLYGEHFGCDRHQFVVG